MHDLIETSIEAHGGLERWNQVREVSATFHPSGLALQLRGQEGFSKQPTQIAVETGLQRVTISPFLDTGHIGIYEPDRTAILNASGAVVDELDRPRASFHPDEAWSKTQLIYFAGHALWTYINAPFLFSRPDFKLEEVEPWKEEGETWRVLKVTFPNSVATLASQQLFYFDSKGMIRREDYAVEVAGTDAVAHYVDGHQEFDGLVFPTQRRIFPKMPDGRPHRDVLVMSADLSDYKITNK